MLHRYLKKNRKGENQIRNWGYCKIYIWGIAGRSLFEEENIRFVKEYKSFKNKNQAILFHLKLLVVRNYDLCTSMMNYELNYV